MSNYFGKAEQAANAIVKAFEENRIPQVMSYLYIDDAASKHMATYSWLNRFIIAIHGHSDAMGFNQWKNKHNRTVKKGEKACYILAPVIKKIEDKDTSEKRSICVGFRGVAVFGTDQTEGDAICQGEGAEKFLNELPFREVATKWGLTVNAYNGQEGAARGSYLPGVKIDLGVKNLSTWTHELAHAADDRNGTLVKNGRTKKDYAIAEVVAELAGAVLLECIGQEQESDRGGAYEYITGWAKRADMKPVDACRKVLTRVVEAVNLIMQEAGLQETEEKKEKVVA